MRYPPFLALMALSLASCAGPSSVLSSSSQEPASLQSALSSASQDPALPESAKYVYNLPKADKVQRLPIELKTSLSGPVMADLAKLAQGAEGNFVVSPASYLLAVSGLASVSRDFPLTSFGLNDAKADLKALLEAWNFEYHYLKEYDYGKEEKYCRFEAVVAHQSVGPTYRFDPAKREALKQDYVSTMESSLGQYHQDATEFFHDVLDFTIPVPDPNLTQDGVLTYGGFKMKDFVPGGLATTKDALFNDKKAEVHCFGSKMWPEHLPYYCGENYQVFRLPINYTDMVIVLPKKGVRLAEISLEQAYSAYQKNRTTVAAMGYVPYFHNHTESLDITSCVAGKLTGKEAFYDALLPETTHNDLKLDQVLQSSDFEFNQYGVSGESITVMEMSGSAAPIEEEVISLNVDRPFYAISEKDGFPLFINRVENL